MTEIAVISFV